MKLGDEIRKWRDVRGWTQDTLAEKSGLSVTYISNLERGGRTQVSFDVVRKLADALHISIGVLAGELSEADLKLLLLAQRARSLNCLEEIVRFMNYIIEEKEKNLPA